MMNERVNLYHGSTHMWHDGEAYGNDTEKEYGVASCAHTHKPVTAPLASQARTRVDVQWRPVHDNNVCVCEPMGELTDWHTLWCKCCVVCGVLA